MPKGFREVRLYRSVITNFWGSVMSDLPIAAVVRIAKSNGAERVGSDAAAVLVEKAENYIGHLAKEANKLSMHAGRKTIKEEDVEMAAKSA